MMLMQYKRNFSHYFVGNWIWLFIILYLCGIQGLHCGARQTSSAVEYLKTLCCSAVYNIMVSSLLCITQQIVLHTCKLSLTISTFDGITVTQAGFALGIDSMDGKISVWRNKEWCGCNCKV